MSDQELKPCPCCGKHAIRIGRVRGIFIQCQGCFLATHFYGTLAEAEKAWNTRTPDPMLEELARVLGDLLFECDCAFDTCKPSRRTYNLGFAALQKYQQSKVQL